MAKIGEYRLRIYDLLFEKPICRYAELTGKAKYSNVLILGTGWIGNEAFKAAFWAGQALNTELNITVASRNATAYKEQVLSDNAKAYMPALKKYSEQKHYANLHFVDVDVEKESDAAGLSALDFENNRYNYIIVSLGNAASNWLAASEIITQITTGRAIPETPDRKILINVFNEFSDEITPDDQEQLEKEGLANGIEVHFFGDESNIGTELDRIARNINFSYSMKYDQRINKGVADNKFEASRVAEFVESPLDYETEDSLVVANFIGAKYTADSSFASAVHIPVKLDMCQKIDGNTEALDTLKEAIQKKNKLYWQLVSLEHRRWNAYMVTRGFRAPTQEEEKNILYQNGNTHQDKKRLLHICLCDCGEKSVLSNNFDRQYFLWNINRCPSDIPSELDRASLRAHQLTETLSAQIDINSVVSMVSGSITEYSNLRQAVQKLFNDEANSVVLYEKSLEAARKYAENISEEMLDQLNKMDEILSVVKIRNARMDFFSLDEQLVEMLPFALWYGKKYGTVITISDGMSTTTHDVIIPTIFCAQKAIFIGKTVNSKKYQKAITTYFESRGGNTIPEFIALSTMSMDAILNCLEKQVESYCYHDLLINCVPNKGNDVLLAIGRLMEKHLGAINIVQYLPQKGIVSFSEDKNIGVGLDNKNYSLSEYLQLQGGRIDNEYSKLYDTKEYSSLMELFKKYNDPKNKKAIGKGSGSFNAWALVTGFCSQVAKDFRYEDCIITNDECEPTIYTGYFSEEVFRNSLIDNVLNQLQDYRIIREYSKTTSNHMVTVVFEYVNPELVALLHRFEQGIFTEAEHYETLKFLPMNDGLKITNRRVENVPLLAKGETEVHKNVKLEFLKDLSLKKYISDLMFNPEDNTVSFTFRDEATMHVMKTQGLIFELIVYFLMRQSGKFDDVETGVKISWNVEDLPQEQQLMDELKQNSYDSFGYSKYKTARKDLIKRTILTEGQSLKNEIDIIALSGMNATMVSCKTSEKDNMQWIYEIKAISDHFQSSGVLAVSTNYADKSSAPFVERAKQMKVALWGTDTLWKTEV